MELSKGITDNSLVTKVFNKSDADLSSQQTGEVVVSKSVEEGNENGSRKGKENKTEDIQYNNKDNGKRISENKDIQVISDVNKDDANCNEVITSEVKNVGYSENKDEENANVNCDVGECTNDQEISQEPYGLSECNIKAKTNPMKNNKETVLVNKDFEEEESLRDHINEGGSISNSELEKDINLDISEPNVKPQARASSSNASKESSVKTLVEKSNKTSSISQLENVIGNNSEAISKTIEEIDETTDNISSILPVETNSSKNLYMGSEDLSREETKLVSSSGNRSIPNDEDEELSKTTIDINTKSKDISINDNESSVAIETSNGDKHLESDTSIQISNIKKSSKLQNNEASCTSAKLLANNYDHVETKNYSMPKETLSILDKSLNNEAPSTYVNDNPQLTEINDPKSAASSMNLIPETESSNNHVRSQEHDVKQKMDENNCINSEPASALPNNNEYSNNQITSHDIPNQMEINDCKNNEQNEKVPLQSGSKYSNDEFTKLGTNDCKSDKANDTTSVNFETNADSSNNEIVSCKGYQSSETNDFKDDEANQIITSPLSPETDIVPLNNKIVSDKVGQPLETDDHKSDELNEASPHHCSANIEYSNDEMVPHEIQQALDTNDYKSDELNEVHCDAEIESSNDEILQPLETDDHKSDELNEALPVHCDADIESSNDEIVAHDIRQPLETDDHKSDELNEATPVHCDADLESSNDEIVAHDICQPLETDDHKSDELNEATPVHCDADIESSNDEIVAHDIRQPLEADDHKSDELNEATPVHCDADIESSNDEIVAHDIRQPLETDDHKSDELNEATPVHCDADIESSNDEIVPHDICQPLETDDHKNDELNEATPVHCDADIESSNDEIVPHDICQPLETDDHKNDELNEATPVHCDADIESSNDEMVPHKIQQALDTSDCKSDEPNNDEMVHNKNHQPLESNKHKSDKLNKASSVHCETNKVPSNAEMVPHKTYQPLEINDHKTSETNEVVPLNSDINKESSVEKTPSLAVDIIPQEIKEAQCMNADILPSVQNDSSCETNNTSSKVSIESPCSINASDTSALMKLAEIACETDDNRDSSFSQPKKLTKNLGNTNSNKNMNDEKIISDVIQPKINNREACSKLSSLSEEEYKLHLTEVNKSKLPKKSVKMIEKDIPNEETNLKKSLEVDNLDRNSSKCLEICNSKNNSSECSDNNDVTHLSSNLIVKKISPISEKLSKLDSQEIISKCFNERFSTLSSMNSGNFAYHIPAIKRSVSKGPIANELDPRDEVDVRNRQTLESISEAEYLNKKQPNEIAIIDLDKKDLIIKRSVPKGPIANELDPRDGIDVRNRQTLESISEAEYLNTKKSNEIARIDVNKKDLTESSRKKDIQDDNLSRYKLPIAFKVISSETTHKIPICKVLGEIGHENLNQAKKRPSGVDKNTSCPKKAHFDSNKFLTSDESDADEDKLIIDESEGSKLAITDVNNKALKEPILSGVQNKSIDMFNESLKNNFNKPLKKNNRSKKNYLLPSELTEKTVEVVDLIDEEDKVQNEKREETSQLDTDSKSYICSRCKEIWSDNILKLLFEGNESVTVNSRITYGAIICMNAYVSIHYPLIKEQALKGLLDRADLAKNLGSIKVSILNSWLIALIQNKKINCCDPFRPIYRMKFSNNKSSEEVKSIQSTQDLCKSNSSNASNGKIKPISVSDEYNSCTQSSNALAKAKPCENESSNKFTHKSKSTTELNEEISKANEEELPIIPKIISPQDSELLVGIGNSKALGSTKSVHSTSITQNEKDCLSPNLRETYEKLLCDQKLTDEEAKNLKRKFITKKEVLNIHSYFILNQTKADLDSYFKLFVQILNHRELVFLIPDGKTLVKQIEYLRREYNRQKHCLKKSKMFLAQEWDTEEYFIIHMGKQNRKLEDSGPTVKDMLKVFCLWKNRALLHQKSDEQFDLKNAIKKLFNEKVNIDDCFGLCIKLYSKYCHLLFEENEIEKAKIFKDLLYVPKHTLDSMDDIIILDPCISYLPPLKKDLKNIINYLEINNSDQRKQQIKRKFNEEMIESVLQHSKKLKGEILNKNTKSPKQHMLLNKYAKLKNQCEFLDDIKRDAESSNEATTIFYKAIANYTPEMKLMVAKLRSANIPIENIPSIIEKVIKNIFKKKMPV